MRKATRIHIEAEIPWRITRSPRGFWVGVCDALNLTVQSETWKHLMEDIGTSIDMVFDDLVENDNLEQFLERKGWSISMAEEGTAPAASQESRFDIPFIPTLVSTLDDQPETVFA